MPRAIALLLLLTAPALSAEPEVIVVDLEWEPGYVGTTYGRKVKLAKEVPADVKLPEKIKEGRYGEIVYYGEHRVLIVRDVAKGSERTWIDSDRDADLTDEPARKWSKKGRIQDTVLIPVGDETVPVDFVLKRHTTEPDTLWLFTRIHRRARVTVGGRERAIALVDNNGDLHFDDAETDIVYLDVDGDGSFLVREGSHERLRPEMSFNIAGHGYRIHVPSPDGATVELIEIKPAPKPARRMFPKVKVPPLKRVGKAPKETVKELAKKFEAANEKGKIALLKKISQHGSKDAFAFLDRARRTAKEVAVREWAVHEMGYVEYESHASKVKKIARTARDAGTRTQALFALHNMGAKGLDAVFSAMLFEANEAKDRKAVGTITEYLAYTGSAKARAALLRAFKAQQVYKIRWDIYDRGTAFDPNGPAPALVASALKDEESAIQGKALLHLWRLDPAKAHAAALGLRGKDDQYGYIAKSTMRILARAGDRASVAIALEVIAAHPSLLKEAERELSPARDPGGVKALASGIRSDSPEVRRLCAGLLPTIGGSGAPAALAAALRKEEDPDAIQNMVEALGDLKDTRAVPMLLKVAKRGGRARSAAVAALARIGFDDPQVRAFFLKLLDSKRWEDRIFAIDAAASTRQVSLVPSIVENLDHDAWQVRLTAIQALRRVRAKASIEPLVERLGKEELRRLKEAIVKTLFELTGQDFHIDPKPWRSWWAANGAGFKVPRKIPVKKRTQSGSVVTFYGVPVRTDRITFVIDASSSMRAMDAKNREKSRLDVARDEILGAAGRLNDSARMNVIFFDDEVDPWKRSLVPLSKANRAALKKDLAQRKPEGQTNLYDALESALLDKSVDTIVLLSDGKPQGGRYERTDDILRAIQRLNQTRRITLHTIAIGRDSALLRKLARANGGTYRRR